MCDFSEGISVQNSKTCCFFLKAQTNWSYLIVYMPPIACSISWITCTWNKREREKNNALMSVFTYYSPVVREERKHRNTWVFFLFETEKKLRRIKGYCSSGTVWSPNTESVAAKLHPNTPGTVSTSNSYLIKETKRKRSIQTLQTQ